MLTKLRHLNDDVLVEGYEVVPILEHIEIGNQKAGWVRCKNRTIRHSTS